MNSVNNVSEKRARMHLELSLAVAEFELSHKVTVCKPAKNKVSRRIRCKEPLTCKSKPPINKPIGMFDMIMTGTYNGGMA